MDDAILRIVLLSVMTIAAAWGASAGMTRVAVPTAAATVAAMLAETKRLAVENGPSGATLLFTPSGTGTLVAVMRSRPFTGFASLAVDRQRRIDAAATARNGTLAAGAPFAVLVAPSGATTIAGYAGTPLAAEPACAGLRIILTSASIAQAHAVDCDGTWR